MDSKPWWTSKTIWVNVATTAVSVLTVALDILGVIDIPNEADVVAGIGSAIAVLNIILRSLTKLPLA